MTPPVRRCDPSLFDKDLKGQVIIVTGANSGIGLETSRQLCKQGAKVILACRNPEKGQATEKELGENSTFLPLDLCSLQSVRDFADAFAEKFDRLDVLIANAGIMAGPLRRTKDGFEAQFGSNHCSHFLLFLLLAPILESTAEKTGEPSRFVAVSSNAAELYPSSYGGEGNMAKIDFDDLNFETRKYHEYTAYEQSKLANYLHALEVSKKYDPKKIVAFSLHPGVVKSNLANHLMPGGFFGKMLTKMVHKMGGFINVVDGAQTTLHCVLADVGSLENGGFYAQRGPFKNKKDQGGGWPMVLSNPNATPETAAKLWEETTKLVEKKE